jgi:NAD dependent epimerase/dehydratase family enzyme
VGAVEHIVQHNELHGPVNTVAPQPVSNREFTRTLAAALNRPAFFGIPAFAARLAPGGMADEVLLSGARVLPRKLQESGYRFRFTDLRTALRTMLRNRAP